MIEIKADFNHREWTGRLILSDLVTHAATRFEAVAARQRHVLFVHDADVVEGDLALDEELGWVGVADWSTLEERPATGGTGATGVTSA